MHLSCYIRTRWFFETYDSYLKNFVSSGKIKILDVGGADWNGEYEFLNDCKYDKDVLDIDNHKGVTIIPRDPYNWSEIEDDTYDVVMSTNTFTFVDYFWLTIREMARVVKPGGIVCVITPSILWNKGYPRSNWGFNRDGLITLSEWAELNLIDASVGGVPSEKSGYEWDSQADDACMIAVKGEPRGVLPTQRLRIERRWKNERKKLPFNIYIRRRLEGIFHHYTEYRG